SLCLSLSLPLLLCFSFPISFCVSLHFFLFPLAVILCPSLENTSDITLHTNRLLLSAPRSCSLFLPLFPSSGFQFVSFSFPRWRTHQIPHVAASDLIFPHVLFSFFLPFSAFLPSFLPSSIH